MLRLDAEEEERRFLCLGRALLHTCRLEQTAKLGLFLLSSCLARRQTTSDKQHKRPNTVSSASACSLSLFLLLFSSFFGLLASNFASYSLPTVHCSLSTKHCLPNTVYQTLSTKHCPLSTIHRRHSPAALTWRLKLASGQLTALLTESRGRKVEK